MPNEPWQQVSADFFGPMADGSYYFVNHDDCSRWAAIDKINTTSFSIVKDALNRLYYPFQSYQFAEYARQMGFTHQRITSRWPRANGEVKSFMKKLVKVVKTATITGKNEELRCFLKTYR